MSARKVTGMVKFFRTLDDQIERFFQWLWRNRKIVGAAVAVLLAAWALGGESPGEPPEEELLRPSSRASVAVERLREHLVDRIWIDRIPKGARDRFHLYFFLKKHPFGVHITFHNQVYRVEEVFQYEVKEGDLRFLFHLPEIRVSTPAHVKKLKDEEHFDMLLELDRDPQAKGAPWEYRRLKQKSSLARLPSVEALSVMLEGLERP